METLLLHEYNLVTIEKCQGSASSQKRMSITQGSDLNNCSVCLDEYDLENHIPRILPCHHSVCEICLESIMCQRWNLVDCPRCRQCHLVDPESGISSFKQNQYILEFIEKAQTQSDSRRPRLQRCAQATNQV